MEPALCTLRNVYFSYPGNEVLRNISLSIYPGEIIGVIGPNGGGKTTLLRLILGFLKPSSGTVTFHTSPHKIAYVPQSIRFDHDFPISVEEVVLTGLLSQLPWYGRFGKKEKEAAAMALEKVQMSAFASVPFGSLSGGQAQRVLIARALVSEPKLLLLDEPTANVDNRSEENLYALLNQLKREERGMAILMVTHDLNVAAKHVDRLVCVQGTAFTLQPDEVCRHFSMGLYTEANSKFGF